MVLSIYISAERYSIVEFQRSGNAEIEVVVTEISEAGVRAVSSFIEFIQPTEVEDESGARSSRRLCGGGNQRIAPMKVTD